LKEVIVESPKITRRDFNKSAAMTVASLALSAGPAVRNVRGANDRIGIGVIGAGGMGQYNMKDFIGSGQVDIVAIADPYEPNLEAAMGLTLGKAKGYKDFRRVLEHKDVDAVINSTPDHWHAIPMIMACEAGKDVYQEKPLSHTLYEGRKMLEAAAKHSRVVQVGTQQRSGQHFQKAVELVRSGKIGKVTYVETWIYGNSWPEGMLNPPDSDPPPWLDWDLWLGPAPYHAYNRNRCIGTFRWFWDYSGGILTDWGTHLIDAVHWAMGVDAPETISASGGIYVIKDNRETPDTLEVLYEYPASPVSGKAFTVRFSNRVANGRGPDGHRYGIQFYGTEGTLFVDRGGFTLWPEEERKDPWGLEAVAAASAITSGGSRQHYPHVLNFLDCVRSRQKPNSDVETMHRSTSAGLLGVIAYRLGRKLTWDAQQEQFPGDAEANKLLTKEYRQPWKVA
jgi:predicted dehydrogenase